MAQKLKKAYEITDAKITFVSLVDKAANKRTFLIKKAADGEVTFTTYGRIVKADADNHFVTGIVYEPMEEDTDGNFMTAEEITKAAYWFIKNGNGVDLRHSFESLENAAVVESWIAKADFEIEGETVKKGTWLLTAEITDEAVWESIQKGEITGFSMGGMGNYSEEDVDLNEVKKESGNEKKSVLKQLAAVFGLGNVKKGEVAEIYEKQSKGSLFWEALHALEDSLRHYDFVTGEPVYETDERKIREALEDFSGIVSSILAGGESVAKCIQPEQHIEKAGKAMSTKNLETLRGIRDSIDTFLKSFDPEDETKEKNEPEQGEDDYEKAEPQGEIEEPNTDDEDKEKEKVEEVKKEADTVTKQELETMVAEAIEKALSRDESTERPMTAEQVQEYIEKAVEKAMEPVLKSRGLPTNLGNETVKKSEENGHYLKGIL